MSPAVGMLAQKPNCFDCDGAMAAFWLNELAVTVPVCAEKAASQLENVVAAPRPSCTLQLPVVALGC